MWSYPQTELALYTPCRSQSSQRALSFLLRARSGSKQTLDDRVIGGSAAPRRSRLGTCARPLASRSCGSHRDNVAVCSIRSSSSSSERGSSANSSGSRANSCDDDQGTTCAPCERLRSRAFWPRQAAIITAH